MRKLLAVMLLWPVWVGAATFWVDFSGTGTGGTTGADVDNLCADTTDASCNETSGDTVYLCNARTTQFPASSMVNGATYNWSCPGGTAASLSVSGSTQAMTLGARSSVTIVEPTIEQTGTAACIGATVAQSITIDGEGTCENCGKRNAVWTNDDTLGVIGPCGAEGIAVGNSDTDGWTFNGLHWKDLGEQAIRFTPASAIAIDNVTITNNYFDTCGDDAGDHCIWAYPGAAGPTFDGWSITDNLIYRSWIAGILLGGQEDAYTPTHTNPSVLRNTCIECGFGNDTGSAFQFQDVDGLVFDDWAGVRSQGRGGVFATFYVRNFTATDGWCEDTTLEADQWDGFCVDIDVGSQNYSVSRIYDEGNTGVSGKNCSTSAQSCSGMTLAIFGSGDGEISSVISNGARHCLFFSKLTSPPVTVRNNIVSNVSCVNPISDAIYIQQNVDGAAMLDVKNWLIMGAGGNAVTNEGADQGDFDYNALWGNAAGLSGQTAGANDLGGNPLLVGGSNPTNADGFRTKAGSPLRGAGTRVSGVTQDYGNRRFKFPPSIGAWEAASGDAAETRTAR